MHGPLARDGEDYDAAWRTVAVAFGVWLVAAAGIGWAIAFTHSAFAFIGITRLPEGAATPATIGVFASEVIAIIIGGVLLSFLARWALRRARCISMAVALTYALVSTVLALYAMCHASWFAGFIQWFTQGRYVSLWGPFLGCIFSLLAGGFVWFLAILPSAGHDPIGRSFLLVLLFAAIYYFPIVSWTTARAVRANRVFPGKATSIPASTSST